MEFKVENICGFLIRSKLMGPAEMQAMRQRWLSEAQAAAGQVPAFLKWLVAKNYITEYQAGMLSRGHVDEFFLGEYKILERIGRGRMAGVYKAAHGSGQIVAIKVLPPSRAKDAHTLARFHREARLAVKLKHPNVVRAYQVGETRGIHFLVMEYLEGEPLDELIARRKRLPPGEAVRIVHQALLGLQHIHEQGMVHRDLKPANLMLTPAPARGPNETTLKSNAKILDIGLAREFFDENAPNESADKNELTGEGVLLGTPDYLAPEQARDPRAIDIRADIYSLGCTLYHLLTGQPPFPDKNILNQMIRHATQPAKPLAEFNPSIPEGLQQIVSWMMAKAPDQRYPTPARAAQALDAFLLVTADSSKPAEESPQMRQYLTWLETSEPKVAPPPGQSASDGMAEPHRLRSGPATPAAPAKPKTNPAVPAAGAKAVGKAAPAKPERRKKRTGVKVTPPPAQSASDGTAEPHRLRSGPVAPAAAAAVAFTAAPTGAPDDQFDVELVELPPVAPPPPAPPPKKGYRLDRRDVIMLALGGAVSLLFASCCTGVSWLASLWLKRE